MSDWSELCNMMNIDNDEDALDKMIDQFIADDKEATLEYHLWAVDLSPPTQP